MKRKYPRFLKRQDRDEYLDRLVANGYQVKAAYKLDGPRPFTVEDIDNRKGK